MYAYRIHESIEKKLLAPHLYDDIILTLYIYSMKQPRPVFLTAAWRKLILANYTCPPELLSPLLPKHTELDLWNGRCYVSLVGFLFCNTKIKGFPIPFHRTFEEVNLRFYVRHFDGKEWKRGVVFVKEIVPKPLISLVARGIYREPYHTHPMKHLWVEKQDELTVSYQWKVDALWNEIKVEASSIAVPIDEGSEAEFITEHYWGYTRYSSEKTNEYQVEHPRWEIYPIKNHHIQCSAARLYGQAFEEVLKVNPLSVFLAEGSDIKVRMGTPLKPSSAPYLSR